MESFSLAFPAVYDVEFARIERRHHLQSEEPLEKQEEPPPLADRNHNEFWDSVVFAGWVGGVAHVLFYGSILALILEVLGLDTGSRRWRFTGFLGVGGLLAGLAVSDAFGWPYLGVALPFGLVGAFIVHAILATFRGRTPDPGPVPWVALGLGAALVGNLVEVHLGLAVTTGKLYFWVLLGMLAAAFHERGALDGAAEPEEGADGASSAWLRIGLMGAAFLVTLLFDFVRASGGAVDEKRATGQQLLFGIGLLVLGLLLLLWWRKAGRAWLGPVLALGVALLFGAVQLQTVSVAGDLKNDLPTMESFARWLLPQYVFVVTALAIGLGIAIAGARRAEALSSRGRLGVAVAAASLFAAALLAWPLALYKSEAESLVKIASVFERSSRFPVAAALYQRATEIDPREARYALYVGKVALKASRAPQPPADVQRWMDMGAQAFERARELSPWDPGHVLNLARLDIRRSELVIPGQDQPYAQRADEEYQRALRMSPNNVVLLNEYALFQLLRRGAIPEAEKNLQKSLEMEPGYFFTYTALGQLYVTRGQRGMGDKLENYKKAIDYYDRSLNMQNSARTAVSLGLLSLEVEDKPTSVARLERALTLGPAPEAARKVHAHLAQLYAALGQPDRAAAHAALSRASS
jgi:tetratricopeptide (TPR) repeat protein